MPFDDWSWGGATGGRSPRHHPRLPKYERFTVQHRITRADAEHPEIVDRVRDKLVDQVQRWCDANGYHPGGGDWESSMDGAFDTVIIRLTTAITPRMDGEWPAIRQAIAEDEADRKAAADSKTTVGDRLDALAESVAVWTARTPAEVREALTEA